MQNSFNLKTLNTEASLPLGNDGKPFVLEGDFCMLTQIQIAEILTYKDGFLYWKDDFVNKKVAGLLAGSIDKIHNRMLIRIFKKTYYQHHLIWILHYGSMPTGTEIDHIDRNSLNNDISNLRICNRSQNNYNKIPPSRTTTGFKGVWLDKRDNMYQAYINADKKRTSLGRYQTAVEAAIAYNKAAIILHGEFALLNPVPCE